jgi:hypothetical protein
MRRRSFLITMGLGLGLLAALIVTPMLLLRWEPSDYAAAAVPQSEERTRDSHACFEKITSELIYDAESSELPNGWGVEFTDRELNSYLQEDFIKQGLSSHLLPRGMSDPRVIFEPPDKVRLGFRYDFGGWNSVVATDLRVWLAKEEPNALCLEIEGFHAGAMPIAAQWLLEHVSDAAREHGIEVDRGSGNIEATDRGIDVTWHRHNGRPTAVLRLTPNQPRSTLLLQGVTVGKGTITIRGKSVEATASLDPTRRLTEGFRLAKAD